MVYFSCSLFLPSFTERNRNNSVAVIIPLKHEAILTNTSGTPLVGASSRVAHAGCIPAETTNLVDFSAGSLLLFCLTLSVCGKCTNNRHTLPFHWIQTVTTLVGCRGITRETVASKTDWVPYHHKNRIYNYFVMVLTCYFNSNLMWHLTYPHHQILHNSKWI